ncbi:MAG: SipW-dependent-type signal peptide-containing protein [Clostridiales bacterium]|nr:SipW-dependent-type signal peptide-containing protein [Clostridiales bacterium]
MKTQTKALGLMMAAVLLVTATIFGTMAYLTDDDQVVNTFTVGNVDIKLDEAKANTDGSLVAGVDRVQANSYKLLPGHTYAKDPMVTVLDGSEESYVRMTMTISRSAELDAIFAPGGANMLKIFNGYDSTNWIYKGNVEDAAANTRTYEFWYKETVSAADGNVALDALFDSITVPGEITNEQLATIEDMTITVNAYAIQADGFETADAAWDAFPAN